MKKLFAVSVCLLVLISCRTLSTSTVTYEPQPQKVNDPIPIMKKIIEQQPPSVAYMPNYVDIDDQCIRLGLSWTVPTPNPSQSSWTQYICYKHVGSIKLTYNSYDKVWIVKIDDSRGKYMYWVYTNEKSDAEQFIDAIYNFVKQPQDK